MVVVAQLAEHSVVVRVVVGSSPIDHPMKISALAAGIFVYSRASLGLVTK
jgi:hypothetical protein